jgi:hypothetical protein
MHEVQWNGKCGASGADSNCRDFGTGARKIAIHEDMQQLLRQRSLPGLQRLQKRRLDEFLAREYWIIPVSR